MSEFPVKQYKISRKRLVFRSANIILPGEYRWKSIDIKPLDQWKYKHFERYQLLRLQPLFTISRNQVRVDIILIPIETC